MTCYWSFILFVAPVCAKGDRQLRQFAGCIYMSSFDVWVSLDGFLNRIYGGYILTRKTVMYKSLDGIPSEIIELGFIHIVICFSYACFCSLYYILFWIAMKTLLVLCERPFWLLSALTTRICFLALGFTILCFLDTLVLVLDVLCLLYYAY